MQCPICDGSINAMTGLQEISLIKHFRRKHNLDLNIMDALEIRQLTEQLSWRRLTMPPSKTVTDAELEQALETLRLANPNAIIRAWQIKDEIQRVLNEHMDESTIRGRFLTMGKPLGGVQVHHQAQEVEAPVVQKQEVATMSVDLPEDLKAFVPTEKDVAGYLERDVDVRLGIHYATDKHPITQGKQGTGKTFSHMYYAYKNRLPFMLISCYPDMTMHKFFGDKTLKDGSIVFREGTLVKMIQNPSVILWDEINAVENSKSYDFHALLQNRELFVKDGDDGRGKIYKLHKDCKMGFAQNPRSAKYIGGTVKPSSFLGRCSYITFPDFTKDEILTIINTRYPSLTKKRAVEFTDFFFEANQYLLTNGIAVDISIRQLQTCIEFSLAGMALKDALDDGMISVLDAISNPGAREGLISVSRTIFKDLSPANDKEELKVEAVKAKIAAQIASKMQAQMKNQTVSTAMATAHTAVPGAGKYQP